MKLTIISLINLLNPIEIQQCKIMALVSVASSFDKNFMEALIRQCQLCMKYINLRAHYIPVYFFVITTQPQISCEE